MGYGVGWGITGAPILFNHPTTPHSRRKERRSRNGKRRLDRHWSNTVSHLRLDTLLFQLRFKLLLRIPNHSCFTSWDRKAQSTRLLHFVLWKSTKLPIPTEKSNLRNTRHSMNIRCSVITTRKRMGHTIPHKPSYTTNAFMSILCVVFWWLNNPRKVPSFFPHVSHLKCRATWWEISVFSSSNSRSQ